MRLLIGLSALTLSLAAPALAQPAYGLPPGSYQRLCTDIRLDGQMLSATCRGARSTGQSSINILSCSTGIDVDAEGGLTCVGPGGGAPPSVRPAPPGYGVGPAYPGQGYGRDRVTLYGARNHRGTPITLQGPAPNLADIGLNDRVASIDLSRGSGRWLVCTDAGYRGRCITIDRSVRDVRQIGMRNAISSLRPIR